LVTAVALDELVLPGLGGPGVTTTLVTMHCVGVGPETDRALDVLHVKLVQSEQVLDFECPQSSERGSVGSHEVLDAKVVITLKPGNDSLGRSIAELRQHPLEAVNMLL